MMTEKSAALQKQADQFRALGEPERLDTLNRLAARGKALDAPEVSGLQLKIPEIFYYLTMRSLYAMKRTGSMDDATLKREKQTVIRTYRNFELVNRIGEYDMRIIREIEREKDFYSEGGCPKCKRLFDELTGLIQAMPEDEIVIELPQSPQK